MAGATGVPRRSKLGLLVELLSAMCS